MARISAHSIERHNFIATTMAVVTVTVLSGINLLAIINVFFI